MSGAALLAFVRGKAIAEIEQYPGGSDATVTTFTDGSALRCTAVEGRYYSEATGGDPPYITWEVSDAP